MKGTYDRQADALAIRLAAPGVAIARTQAFSDDVILDLAADGTIATVEILGVSTFPELGKLLRRFGIDLRDVEITPIGAAFPWPRASY